MTPVTNHYCNVILHTDNLPLPFAAIFDSKRMQCAQISSAAFRARETRSSLTENTREFENACNPIHHAITSADFRHFCHHAAITCRHAAITFRNADHEAPQAMQARLEQI
jgi:hypothetical protein